MDKKVQVKIYNSDGGSLITTITKLKTLPDWSLRVNDVPSESNLLLNERFDNIPGYITLNNLVKIYEVSQNYKLGKLAYTGYISEVRPYRGASLDEVEVGILSIGDLLKNVYFKDGTNFDVAYTTTDLAEIFRDVIDYFNTIYPGELLSYDASSIQDTGILLTYTFEKKRCIEVLREVFNFCDPAWYWYVDVDGKVYLKESAVSPQHAFTLGKNIESIKPSKTMETINNVVTVFYSGGDKITVESSTSKGNYGTRETVIEDENIPDSSLATQRATKLLVDLRDPKITASGIVVNDNYDLTIVKPGDTCKFRNYNKEGGILEETQLVTEINYQWNKAVINLGQNRSDIARILDLFINKN